MANDPRCDHAAVHKLRDQIVATDLAVRGAYGWDDLNLGHGFHGEGRTCRFTISPSARQEVLRRLLKLNHQCYAEEVAAGLHDEKKGGKGKKAKRQTTRFVVAALATPRANLFDDQQMLREVTS